MAVVEVTSFEVREGSENAFEAALARALPILTRQSGYIGHESGASVERPSIFWLIVRWETLENHIDGFQKSADFKSFVGFFRQFLEKPAVLSHFEST